MTDLAINLLKYLPVLLLAAPAMFWAYGAFKYSRQWRFILIPMSLMAIAFAAVMAAAAIPWATRDPWSPTRLAPIISMTHGYPLYYPQGQGPIIIRMYAPVSSLVYLPAALAETPTYATLIGAFINFALFSLPVIWFIHRATRQCCRDIFLAAVGIFFATVMLHEVLRYSATMVTVDAPAMGMATCAMAVLIGATNQRRDAAIFAGLFAAMAMWSKQTFVAIVPVVCIYMLLALPTKQVLRSIGIVLGMVAGVSLAMLLVFGWDPLFFNLVMVPGNRDWQWHEPTTAAVLLRALRTIWQDSSPVNWLLIVALVARHRFRIAKNPWMLPLIAAILILPLGAIAYAQIGGRSNNGSPTIFFSLLACVTALASASGSIADSEKLSRSARVARLAIISILAFSLVTGAGYLLVVPDRMQVWSELPSNPHESAYLFAKAHPGEVWFPKQTLATLMAEGKLYHFDEGLYALELAKVPVRPDWYTQGLPAGLRWAGYRGNVVEGPMTPPPGFDRITTLPELPGWVFVIRPAGI